MRLGLIADIHEHVEFLRVALHHFGHEQVDRIVVLGDVFETGERIEETCRLLAGAHAVGVWGNHDFGLCDNPADRMWAKYPATVIEYMTTLRPRLELDGCYFAHVEPWLDPQDIHDLWFFEGPPDNDRRRKQIFAAVPHRRPFRTSRASSTEHSVFRGAQSRRHPCNVPGRMLSFRMPVPLST
jgi:hypothetical protein